MSGLQQVLLGSGLLALSAIVHVCAVAISVPMFRKLAAYVPPEKRLFIRIAAFMTLTVGVLLFAHTVQVWAWAVTFLVIADLPDISTSFYFSTVTYTTLGYGDIVLGEGARIVATFCAIAGLLTFGISTAFLIGVLSKVLPDVLGGTKS